jgi:prepilin-type N-terminal cleavage/methylation domain-containing protein/prepilin-type processing-associated H-X9-DG protein
MIRNSSSARGFTLLELLVVIVVAAILASIGYPAFIGALERAKVAKDMNNLRQLGLATQTYMNDNDGTFPGSATVIWMSQLHPKYASAWGVFQSPFDNRGPSEQGNANTPVSYGINPNVFGTSASQITNPTISIVFAAAEASGPAVSFSGTAVSPAPAVTVVSTGTVTTMPNSGMPIGGTHSSRVKINALFADWHVENMSWSLFKANTNNPPSDPCGAQRWNPTATCP